MFWWHWRRSVQVSAGAGYFIFTVSFGQFPENGQRQMAYIIYLIEVRRNADKKLNIGLYKCNNFFINVCIKL
jgi:hypothetical protein